MIANGKRLRRVTQSDKFNALADGSSVSNLIDKRNKKSKLPFYDIPLNRNLEAIPYIAILHYCKISLQHLVSRQLCPKLIHNYHSLNLKAGTTPVSSAKGNVLGPRLCTTDSVGKGLTEIFGSEQEVYHMQGSFAPLLSDKEACQRPSALHGPTS
ncbi:Hypothetical predicted protein, partial [Mytilus galloprovincialis]